jgi:tRNA A37 threonylcarbamoyladenosine dehydratase
MVYKGNRGGLVFCFLFFLATSDFIKQIFPHIYVEICEEYLTKDNILKFLTDSPDYVLDCIDNKGKICFKKIIKKTQKFNYFTNVYRRI